jgi:hypothetical protein
MRRTSFLTAAAMAAVASAGLGSMVVSASEAPGLSVLTHKAMAKQAANPAKSERSSMRAMLGGGIGSSYTSRRRAGYGWTNMHARRVATKKRNKARHRAASRG